jgi:methylenetetrahydrofolate dehydrogenase (NADP+)/methenyltetrahydrofolate cyclohydrolase
MAALLLGEQATVTVAHIHTRDTAALCRRADILVSAVGVPGLVRGDWIKPGATVIDVGINRMTTPLGKSVLVGDVVFEEALRVAGAVTPVPGGVGPMTIACLMANTLVAAKARRCATIDTSIRQMALA